jgi:hypothetical protein
MTKNFDGNLSGQTLTESFSESVMGPAVRRIGSEAGSTVGTLMDRRFPVDIQLQRHSLTAGARIAKINRLKLCGWSTSCYDADTATNEIALCPATTSLN